MADIVIFVSSISVNVDQLHVNGIAYVRPKDTLIGWGTDIAWTDPTVNVNAAIATAAISAARSMNFTVDPVLDKQTIYGISTIVNAGLGV